MPSLATFGSRFRKRVCLLVHACAFLNKEAGYRGLIPGGIPDGGTSGGRLYTAWASDDLINDKPSVSLLSPWQLKTDTLFSRPPASLHCLLAHIAF